MKRVGLVGLIKIELPGHTIRLCDGGFVTFGGELYTSKDEIFGAIGSIESLTEGEGDEVPALEINFAPPGTSEPADISSAAFQTARAWLWIGEYDVETGALDGTPDLMFDGQVDQTILNIGAAREVDMSVVSTAERLFEGDIGNSLNPTFHRSVWPGEAGHDNATGLSVPVAWGAENSSTNGVSAGYSSGSGGKAYASKRGMDYR